MPEIVSIPIETKLRARQLGVSPLELRRQEIEFEKIQKLRGFERRGFAGTFAEFRREQESLERAEREREKEFKQELRREPRIVKVPKEKPKLPDRPFERFIPALREQQARFEQVFGVKVTEQIRKEQEEFKRRVRFEEPPTVIEPQPPQKFFQEVKDPNTLRRIKTETIKRLKDFTKLPFAFSSTLGEVFAEQEKQLAEQGRFIFADTSTLAPKRETAIFTPEFLTDKQLEGLSFGGLDTLVKRQEKKLDVTARNVINSVIKEIEPEFQGDVEKIVSDFNSGKINQSQAESGLKILENKFQKEVLAIADPKIDIQTQEVQSYVDSVAKQQRKNRALILAPVVFGEGFLFGKGIGLVTKGVAVTGTALGIKGSSDAVRVAVGAGFLGAIALQTPTIVAGVREDPLAFTLENAPFLAGAVVGINPKLLAEGNRAGRRFINFERQLFNDKTAKAGTKGRQKTKQIQVQRSKKKVQLSAKELKEILERMNRSELKEFIKTQSKFIENIKDPAQKQLAQQQLSALLLELKTGVSIFDESGNVLLGQVAEALKKAKLSGKVRPAQLLEEPSISPRLKPVAVVTTSRFSSLGVLDGRIKTLDVQKSNLQFRQTALQKDLQRARQLEKQAVSPFQKQSQKNRQKQIQRQISFLRQQESQLTKQTQRTRQALALRTQQIQKQRLSQQQRTIQMQRGRLGVRRKGKPFKPVRPFFIKIPELTFGKKKVKVRIKPGLKRKPGYHVFVKTKGKFRKITKRPARKSRAKDFGALVTDKSTSRTFVIKKTKRPAQKLKRKVPTNYFKKTKHKYRAFRIRKGTKKPLLNSWIEKRRFAIDTKSEKKQLSVARVLAGLKKTKTIPIRGGVRTPKSPKKIKLKSTKLIKFKKRRK